VYVQVHLLEELLSPVITPFILCFHLRSKSQDIVDFYRNFTVEVVGVGDVCSFAQMDVRRHGNPAWQTNLTSPPGAGEQMMQHGMHTVADQDAQVNIFPQSAGSECIHDYNCKSVF
jgi:hypothetical protein